MVKMTPPTVIFFGPDVPRSRSEAPLHKIYLRTLLFSTSKRGRIIQSMHVASHEMRHTKTSTFGFMARTASSEAAACLCG